uniref:Uncharacterized protein n=1 Tax=Strigamia maritima TaxID=126957 RepID=T1ILA2_STRMM
MSDIFSHQETRELLSHKKVVIIGDENTRGLYKDIVCLLNKNELLAQAELRAKLEPSFLNDRLIKGPSRVKKDRDYKEEREFRDLVNHQHVDFFFVTRCYDQYFEEKIMKNFKEKLPDVVIMNSCLWDITRWGPNGVDAYKANMRKLMTQLKATLDENCLFVWTTSMPISRDMQEGLLISDVKFLPYQLRFEIMEANLFAWDTITRNGFDVLDLHYYMQMNILRRREDGISWCNTAVRHVTNYVLTHIALAWGVKLPGRIKSKELEYVSRYPIHPEFPPESDKQEPTEETPTSKKKKLLRPMRRAGDRR